MGWGDVPLQATAPSSASLSPLPAHPSPERRTPGEWGSALAAVYDERRQHAKIAETYRSKVLSAKDVRSITESKTQRDAHPGVK